MTEIFLEYSTGVDVDDFYYKGSFSAISYSFSGSATFDLTKVGDFNFGDLVIGTYDLDGHSGFVPDTGHSLVIQYSSVPNSDSTAALLLVGVAALAFARRRRG